MSLEDLGNIGEFVAAIGVIVSLIYLAVQIRQNTRSVRTSTYQSLVESVVDFNTACARDPELASAYIEGMEDTSELSEVDRRRFAFSLFSLFHIFESMFYQRQQFTIESRYWEGWRALMLSYYARPGVQQWWQIRRDAFSPEFRNFLESEKLDRPLPSSRETVERLSFKQQTP